MTEMGHGLQIVNITNKHSYELNEDALKQLLMNEEVKDLPVVVVSVAGAYRGGKSFLLNFFLRYLSSPQEDRQDGSWLGENSEPLAGFTWRTGIDATTMGILMWSKPYITTLPTGEKVAVLLMDTQGTFDSRSTVRDCSTIFALSTLLSSVQIYNIFHNIQEDDLQYLQLFTAFGQMVKSQGGKAFQVLEFLVRDWQYPEDYEYGAEGGERLLEKVLEITYGLADDMKKLREHIRTSFEKVSCFLMPHPGQKVLRRKFKGEISSIDEEFKTHLKSLVASLFGPDKLMPKTINGEKIKARDLYTFFKTYVNLYNSDEIPNPTTIMKATVEAGLLTAMNESIELYEKRMDAVAGPKQPSVAADDLTELHIQNLARARNAFSNKKTMGSKEDVDKYLKELNKKLEARLPQFISSNVGKIQKAINNAKEAYEAAIKDLCKNQELCVHPLDLEKIHRVGYNAAINIFDAARKKLSNKKDDERDQFIKNLEKRYTLLRLTNEQNNKILVKLLRADYWEQMLLKSDIDPPLSSAEFTQEHEIARAKALKDFDLKRNLPNNYTEDVFKYNLKQAITESYDNLKKLNRSKNKTAMNAGLKEYEDYMKKTLDTQGKCLHPDDFERNHERGKCRALETFRPQKQCSDGFDSNDDDEALLLSIIQNHYKELKDLNDSANESAVQEAYNFYVSTIDEKCRTSLWWLAAGIIGYPIALGVNSIRRKTSDWHSETKTAALVEFYNKRKETDSHAEDKPKDRLVQMMNSYYENI